MKLKKMMLRSMAVLCVLCLATGCSKEQQEEKKEEKSSIKLLYSRVYEKNRSYKHYRRN